MSNGICTTSTVDRYLTSLSSSSYFHHMYPYRAQLHFPLWLVLHTAARCLIPMPSITSISGTVIDYNTLHAGTHPRLESFSSIRGIVHQNHATLERQLILVWRKQCCSSRMCSGLGQLEDLRRGFLRDFGSAIEVLLFSGRLFHWFWLHNVRVKSNQALLLPIGELVKVNMV